MGVAVDLLGERLLHRLLLVRQLSPPPLAPFQTSGAYYAFVAKFAFVSSTTTTFDRYKKKKKKQQKNN